MVLSDLILGMVAGAAMVVLWPHVVAPKASPASAIAPPMSDDPCPAPGQPVDHDWAWLCRYRADNARIGPATSGSAPRVVFMGDSITELWLRHDPGLFAEGIIDRGISGQTSPQMLLRFTQDVVALHPRVVQIMAGTNDIGGNTGPTSPDQFKNNIMAMVTLAQANHIRVVLASIPPSVQFGFNPRIKPGPWIAELNAWLKSYAASVDATYADYHAVLAEPDGRIKDRFSADGVHPNALGYQAMRPVAEAAIERALQAGDK